VDGAAVGSTFGAYMGTGASALCGTRCKSLRLPGKAGTAFVAIHVPADIPFGTTLMAVVKLYPTPSTKLYEPLVVQNDTFVVREATTPTTTMTSTATTTPTKTAASTATTTADSTVTTTAASTATTTAATEPTTTVTTTGTSTVTTTLKCNSDLSAWWKDSAGYTCADYARKKWCTVFGEYGPKWGKVTARHSFDAYASLHQPPGEKGELIAANKACCVCGGGYRVKPHHPDNTKAPTSATTVAAPAATTDATTDATSVAPAADTTTGSPAETETPSGTETTQAATTTFVKQCCEKGHQDHGRCPADPNDASCSTPFVKSICPVGCGICMNCACCTTADHGNCPSSSSDTACLNSVVASFCPGVCGMCKVCTTTPTTFTTPVTIATVQTTEAQAATTAGVTAAPANITSSLTSSSTTVTTTTTVTKTTVTETTTTTVTTTKAPIYASCANQANGAKCYGQGEFCGIGECDNNECHYAPKCEERKTCVNAPDRERCEAPNPCKVGKCFAESCREGVAKKIGTACSTSDFEGVCGFGAVCTKPTTTVATPPITVLATTAPVAPPSTTVVESCANANNMVSCFSGCNLGICISSECIKIVQSRCSPGSQDPLCLPGGICAPTDAPATSAPAVTTLAATEATKAAACDINTEYQCANFAASGQCIPKSQYCDSRPDCVDGSDEGSCPEKPTVALQTFTPCDINAEFQCANFAATGQCISKSKYCDSFPDCGDASDEQTCVATPTDAAPLPVAGEKNSEASSSDDVVIVLVVLVVLMLLGVFGFVGFRFYQTHKA